MGRRGPVPKPSDQVRRRNKTWIDKTPAGSKRAKPDEPPRSGKGSGTDVWRAYAEDLGYEVDKDATRGQIIAMIDEGPPDTDSDSWHPLARDWYRSLAESGQSAFYEPSDWQTARILTELLSRALKSGRITAALIERWQVGATELLTTEGARRRMRIELDRETESQEETVDVSDLDEFRRRRRGAS